MRIITGDLLLADTEYIIQQNCCTAIKAHGLSKTIASKWPDVNPYKDRRKLKGNWSILEDRPEPGSIEVYNFDVACDTGLKGVICIFAQVCHGLPYKYEDPLKMDEKYGDTPKDRIQYFTECLQLIETLDPKPKSIGIPYKIGCGLAGGSWIKYESIIRKWSEANPDIDVRIYKLD
jgi:hypothetical protein